MTPKWTIRKYPKLINGKESDFPWKAFRPGVTPPENPLDALWACETLKRTFSEALRDVNYELSKPRTVEVVPPVKPGQQKFLQNSYVRGAAFDQVVQLTDMANHECICIDKFDWKELGEYLLALHYEKGNNNDSRIGNPPKSPRTS